jgi:MSHA biogenesis protein MshO
MSRLVSPPVGHSWRSLNSHGGFTLIELVVVITLSAVVVSFMVMFTVMPLNAYRDQGLRAELIESGDSLVRMLRADVRKAVPTTLRSAQSGSVTSLSMLNSVGSGRYFSLDPNPMRSLSVPTPDTDFSSMGGLLPLPATVVKHIVVANVTIPNNDVYKFDPVISAAIASVTVSNGTPSVHLSVPMSIQTDSPSHRFYLVDSPITYLCDSSTHDIRRYSGHTVASAAAAPPTAPALISAGATETLVAINVQTCSILVTNEKFALYRGDLVIVNIQLANNGGTTRVFEQIEAENPP